MKTKNKYKITELNKAKKEFSNLFEINLNEYLDNLITASIGVLVLDIPFFHEFLLKKNQGYEKKSFNDLITEKYGIKGTTLIKKLTL